MLGDLMGKKSVAHFVEEKKSSGVVRIVVNKTKGGQQLVQKIHEGDITMHLSRGTTAEASFSQILKGCVIKKLKTHLSNEDIKSQLKWENHSLNSTALARIVSRNNFPSTVAVITYDGKEMPETVYWDQ